MGLNQDWESYFENRKGHGYLSTSDGYGKVNTAVYSRPHVQDDGKFAFIMNEGRSVTNLRENSYAIYAFDEGGASGHRIYLEKSEILIEGLLYEKVLSESRKPPHVGNSSKHKYVALLNVCEIRPLIGG